LNEKTIAELRRQTITEPLNPAPWRALGLVLQATAPGEEATACLCAAMALEARSPLALYNLATVYFQARRMAEAERWYRLTLALDPTLVAANQNLAALLEEQQHYDEARHYRDIAFTRQSVFVEQATAPEALTVLVLSASAAGNVPIDFLLPRSRYTRIKWFIDYAPTEKLPDFDIVFNALGDSDVAAPALASALRFLEACDRPVLNHPAQILGTTRDQIWHLLAPIERLVAPKTLRWEATAPRPSTLNFPVLARPIGSHGGQGVVRIETADELGRLQPAPRYLTPYHDYRSADGLFRKYRVIFVDRVPYPYHLAISQNWLVHYFSADMAGDEAKRAEEQLFLENPAQSLGAAAWETVGAIGRHLNLDYAGVDFALLADGRVLLFEANATMLAHLADERVTFAYKHRALPALFDAFYRMVDQRVFDWAAQA
jgi:tetratricopeptide (TPR) repeat protein